MDDWNARLLKARQKLGKYRIEKRLANGPLAAVYQAYDTIHGDRVALKLPQLHARSDFYLEDFRREARLSAKLRHFNILPIRDASIINGHFVIAMPLGIETLAQRMKRRISIDTTLSLIQQALDAVAHAHELSVLHCDIKPENFILFSGNQLCLTDFAISKVALETIKASGSGTVGYMAPEQAVGRPRYQSDVFALGLVFHQLLTGEVPDWPYRWPTASAAKLRTKLTPELINWLRRSLEVKPEKRFRDARVMGREFKRLRRAMDNRRTRRRNIKQAADPVAWQSVLFKQFQRKHRKQLETRHVCTGCHGPIAESMRACPWCGSAIKATKLSTTYPSECPRCARGMKLDWQYCAWCYGGAFEVETSRHYPDARYTHHCANSACRGELMPFMRYCPWCRKKVRQTWKLEGSRTRCPSCQWGVDRDFWQVCPWCSKSLEK